MECNPTKDKVHISRHHSWSMLPGNPVFQRLFAIFILVLSGATRANAQNCTANAGGNTVVCGSTTTLTGTVSGILGTLNSPLWTFVSGPVTPAIVSPNNLTTNITGMTADGNYTFRLTRTCNTGTATSDVTITAHPRPASFTAGPNIKNVCATTGTTTLGGVIPAGFTGEWRSVNIFSLARFSTTVSTNSQFSSTSVATPTFSLINKANHEIDPAYYAILKITSNDGICSYEDTAIVSFIPNPNIIFPANTNICAFAGYNPTTYNFLLTSSSPGFSTAYAGSAGTAANGDTVTMNVISQPAGGNLSLGSIESRMVLLNGLTTSGSYVFTLTVSNACGTYTTPQYTYTIGNPLPHPVNFQPTGHGAPEQLVIYSFTGTGGEHHCNSMAGTTTSETFYFDINALDSPTVYTTVTPSGNAPPGGFPIVVVSGAGTRNRVATVTPPAGGWRVGTYKFSVLASYAANMSCSDNRAYYIHVSDNARPSVTVNDVSVCYPGTGVISANIPLPNVYKEVVNSSYFQEFDGQYNFSVVSKPAGSGTPAFTASNLRSLTSTSTTISNLTTAGDYVFRVTPAPYTGSVGGFLGQEYACSGTSMVDTFVVHVENPINANAGSDQTLNCANSLTLLGNNQGAGTGLWTKVSSPAGSNPVIGSTSTANTTVTNVDVNGTYTYSWSITSQYGGCASRDTVSFVVSSLAPATPVTTVTDYSCAGTAGSIAINSPVGAAYEYSINGTTWQSAPTFSGLAGGAYTISVRYTGSSTCITTKNDTVKLAVCGTVFNDVNRNEIINSGENFTSLPAPMYVYLINKATNQIVDSVSVAANGTYTLKAIANQNYMIELSTLKYAIGTNVVTMPVNTTPPTRYVTTGENKSGNNTGTGDGNPDGILDFLTVTTTNRSNMNFGITCASAGTSANTPLCANETSVMPLSNFITGQDAGGTWTYATGSGITFNAGAGTIQLTSTATNSTFQYAFPAMAGCAVSSSIATVTLRSIPVNTRNITICQGDSACVYNPRTTSLVLDAEQKVCYTTSGTYIDTLRNAAASGCDSVVITNLTVNACIVNISGNVFNDANGNKIINTGETFSSLPAPLYVYLVNSSNVITDSAHVAANGSYTLQASPNQNYTLQLSVQQYPLGTNTGTTPISKTPPTGWVTTGENGNNNTGSGDGTPDGLLAVTVGNTNSSNANFGIEQKPVADAKSFSVTTAILSATAPGNFSNQAGYKSILASSSALSGYSTGGSLSGTDPEDCAAAGSCNTATGTTFSIAAINANTKLYYDYGGSTGVKEITPSPGNPVLIPDYDASKMLIMIQDGTTTSAGFVYSMVDKAGVSGTPVNYSIQFTTPLPVTLVDFSSSKVNSTAVLKWTTTYELNAKGFEVEKSNDGKNWQVFDFVESKHANSVVAQQYTTTDIAPYTGINYYRLKLVDLNGSFAYSNIRSVMFAATDIRLSPNPVNDVLSVKGLPSGTSEIYIATTLGAILRVQKAESSSVLINMKELAQGTYFIVVKLENGELKRYKVLKN